MHGDRRRRLYRRLRRRLSHSDCGPTTANLQMSGCAAGSGPLAHSAIKLRVLLGRMSGPGHNSDAHLSG
jgi:hypothetical protein